MVFSKSKSVSLVSHNERNNGHFARTARLCPKTSKPLNNGRKYHWLVWGFPILGLFSLIWFLIRVIPKPSRATYPCQRFAAPFAGGFVVSSFVAYWFNVRYGAEPGALGAIFFGANLLAGL
jgi:hypothetical protein